MQLRTRVLRSGVKFGGLKLLAVVAAALAGFLSARLLGPEGYGIWESARLALVYIPFLPLGVDAAAYRDIPLLRGKEQYAAVQEVKDVYLTFALLVALLSAVILLIVSFVVPCAPLLSTSLRVVALMGFLSSIARWAIIVLKTGNSFGKAGLAEAMPAMGNLIAAPLIHLVGFAGIWLGSLVGVVGSAAVAWSLSRERVHLHWHWPTLRRLIITGFPIMLTSVVYLLSVTGDKMLVLGFLGTTQVGLYSFGRSVSQILYVSGGVAGPVIFPRLSERWGKTNDVTSLINLVILPSLVMGSFLPLLMGYAWFGLPVVIRFFMPDYVSVILPAQILFLGVAIWLVTGTSGYLLLILDRQRLYLGLCAGATAVSLILEYTALKFHWALVGVAGGALVGNVLLSVVVMVVAFRLCKMAFKAQVKHVGRSLMPLLATLGICLLLDYGWDLETVSLWVAVGVGAVKGTLAALVGLLLALDAMNKAFPFWRSRLSARLEDLVAIVSTLPSRLNR